MSPTETVAGRRADAAERRGVTGGNDDGDDGSLEAGDREREAGEAALAARSDPAEVGPASWWVTSKRTVARYRADDGGDLAAALTYYAVLSIFPGLLVLVALLGLFGQHPQTTDALLGIVDDLGPASAVDTFRSPIEEVTRSGGGAGALLGVGLLGAIWSASGYLGAFARASNRIYGVDEGRPVWKLRPQQVGITLLLVFALALLAIGLVVTGPLASAIGDAIGAGSAAVTIWGIAKWPLMIVLVAVLLATLYHWAPNVAHTRFRWITAGSLLALGLWVLASVGFAAYVASFGSYNATYGSIGGVIVFLLWLWITNNAVLLGQELNAELDGQREARRHRPDPPRTE